MIIAKQARELLRVPQPHLLTEALETAITLGERVNAQAEQIARVEAFAQRFQEAAKNLRDGPAKTIGDAYRHGLKADEYDYFATSLRHALGGQP